MVLLSKARAAVLVGVGAVVAQMTPVTTDPGMVPATDPESMTSTDTVSSMMSTDTVSSIVSTDSMSTDSVSSETMSTSSSDAAITTASTDSGIIFTDPFTNTISTSTESMSTDSVSIETMSTESVSTETMSTFSMDTNTISATMSTDSQSVTSGSMTETASESQSTIFLSIETNSDSQSTSTVDAEMSAESSSATISTSSDASMSSDVSSTQSTGTASESESMTISSTESLGEPVAITSFASSTGSQSSDATASSTETASASASSTETMPRPAITVTSRVVRSFAAIFDEAQVPDGTGSYVNLTVVDTTLNVTRRDDASYVAQYLGCYLFNGLTSPFTADDSRNFIGNAEASATAAGCAAACAGSNYALSANNQGDCFCGNVLDAADLSRRPDRSSCSAACAGDEYQSCGGGALLGGRNSFFSIIETVNAAEADIVVLDETNSITSTITGTAAATNTESASSSMTDAITGTDSMSTNTASSVTVPTSTGTETGTSSSAMLSPTNGVPGVQSISQSVIAGVLNDGGAAQAETSANQGDVSGGDSINGGTTLPGAGFRVPAGGYLGGQDAAFNPSSCSGAASFNLTDGELTSSDGSGARVAADPSVDAYVPLAATAAGTMGSLIAGTFASVDGVLHWANESFYGGEAGFCQAASGEIYATFAEAGRWPTGCVSISLTLYRAEQCRNGTLVDASLIDGPSTPTSSTPGSTTTGGSSSGLASMSSPVPSSQNIFPIGASQTGASCVETGLSWTPGPTPTFIRA
ncbi:hypothetical protein LQW54_001103 [Pestalotiopsis sp. IQ-011]